MAIGKFYPLPSNHTFESRKSPPPLRIEHWNFALRPVAKWLHKVGYPSQLSFLEKVTELLTLESCYMYVVGFTAWLLYPREMSSLIKIKVSRIWNVWRKTCPRRIRNCNLSVFHPVTWSPAVRTAVTGLKVLTGNRQTVCAHLDWNQLARVGSNDGEV